MHTKRMAFWQSLLIVAALSTSQAAPGAEDCPWSPLLSSCPVTAATRQSPNEDGSWTGPQLCVGSHCVYQLPGGVVLATTAENARIVREVADAYPVVDGSGSEESSFYEAEIPGKGIGLIANRTIRRGEHIMAYTPTLMSQLLLHNTIPDRSRDKLYDNAVQKLPAARRRAFLNMIGATISEKLDKNCFRMGVGGDPEEGSHFGCFPEVARFNHDCRPNTQYHLRDLIITVTAVRDISAGEELSISYIDAAMPRRERLERLRRYGFDCACAQCSLKQAAAAASDARMHKIAHLKNALDRRGGGVTASTGAELVALYEMERLDMYLGKAHMRAALNYALFGDVSAARREAGKALDALVREYGPLAEDIPSMRTLAERPEEHWTWQVGRGQGGSVVRGDRAERP